MSVSLVSPRTSRPATASHYDEKYFYAKQELLEFGGWANLVKFEQYIKPSDNVLDFGSGGGYLLKNLDCRGKLGVEINETARQHATQLGIQTHASTADIPDDWADVIISNHVLEHVDAPVAELQALLQKLKTGGRIVFVVPCESLSGQYQPNDINQHLYTWNPLCLGNLFAAAGFVVEESKPFLHKWKMRYRKYARFGNGWMFHALCRMYGFRSRGLSQIRIVARKDEPDCQANA